ncbi:glycosyltransferase [Flavobacterium ajazii]|uniref:glycosyltransferase n=1 Tax=Flavobacterium ajazii TaxID=2692318 RepID=UPI0013D8A596|nr:glycosyltransferase [Flavobacterium ajazii]
MKVKYYPCQPHCFAFGGFDMQMLNTMDSVIKCGILASKLDVWSRDSDFDIIHLWGIGTYNYQVIDWSKKAEKFIVATVLLPYFGTIRSKIGHFYRVIFSKSFKQQIRYYEIIDRIIVVNDLQGLMLNKYYKVPFSKIDIIPNIVENQYFEKQELDFGIKYGIRDYVLCTGNISARKNQYNLALACINLKQNLVLIGNILDGELSYGKKLEELVESNHNVLWIKELPKGSEDLVAAYQNCSLFALPSFDETQPISALEATAMNKPVVLMDKSYAHQSYYKDAILCKSHLVKDIEIAINNSLESNNKLIENLEILKCKEENVGKMYRECYFKLFTK